MWKHKQLVLPLLLLAGLGAQAQSAPRAVPEAAQLCVNCHVQTAEQMKTVDAQMVPMLGGQHADYLAVAIKAYSRRQRDHLFMRGIASGITSLLKTEIARLARKEVRAETDVLKRAVGTYRSEIAALKRRADALEKQLRQAGKVQRSAPPELEDKHPGFRFSAGLAAHRKRIGLSASEMGKLLGASGQLVYKWESGDARPRAQSMPGINPIRTS